MGDEDSYRLRIFTKTLEDVTHFNTIEHRTYDMGINQFSHLTDNEFANLYTSTSQKQLSVVDEKIGKFTSDVDWVIDGKVSAIKDQGTCDAGYAFSTTGLI